MLELARIVNCNFVVLAIVITIVNYDRKTFIVQATSLFVPGNFFWLVKHLRVLTSSVEDRLGRLQPYFLIIR